MNVRYRVTLGASERAQLVTMLLGGKGPARRLKRAQIPLAADKGSKDEEIGVMVGQCLNRRIPDKATLVSEIAHWERRRNRDRASIDWMFTVERAREKLGRAYPAHKGHPARRRPAAA